LQLSVTQGEQTLQNLLRYEAQADGSVLVHLGDARFTAQIDEQLHEKGQFAHVFAAQGATQLIAIDPFWQESETGRAGGRLTAPMPGKVASFAVKAGDVVKAGQLLAVMEAMKMEHTIAAPRDGTVAELLYAPGDQVAEGVELIKLAP
jgi:3-methylcrotonyl-CoA carboxylase alpha subunit